MSSSFAYEDPLLRQNLSTTQKTTEIFKDMGRGMWRSGKGFGKVGALYAGIECVIESVRKYSTELWLVIDDVIHYSIERETTW
jgi:import inner membrane translocase subunit TIM22